MANIFFESISKIMCAWRIRSARVSIRYTKFMIGCIRMFYTHGLIRGYSLINYYNWQDLKYVVLNHMFIVIFLKYTHGSTSLFSKLNSVSRPGRRVYWTVSELSINTFSRAGDGYYILSTNKGLFTSLDLVLLGAYDMVVSGEVLLRANF